ncbi:hypothetical protein BD311DRAFT_865160 [Dichomitus squalens]|uniref:FHA domain-containing protein n=1 Tax=Dichomitus squalens TaxID=114155 RepID=A0A4V2K0G7_9APHY|nr:hypothetical protein BD311DRAFT_865160 [Dichomitus squalens]
MPLSVSVSCLCPLSSSTRQSPTGQSNIMWIITGPFDDDHSEGHAPDKDKLLKTGREYGLGRRDQPLQIKSKAISKAHALFIVGPCSEDQAADPAFVPTLTFQNLTDRIRPIERPSQSRPRVPCQPKNSIRLENRDIVHLSASIFVRVRWETICCYNPPGKGVPHSAIEECAQLGIHVVPTFHPDVTHHLTPTYALTPSIAASLIAAVTLVKPEWLTAVLAAGRADEPGELSLLEEHCVLPPTTKHRPGFAASLPPPLKKYEVWERDERRAAVFRGARAVFVGERGAEAQSALRELVKRGGGEYECFAAANGREAFRQVLAKGRARGAAVVPVAGKEAVVAAVGRDGWAGLVEEARSFELKFVPPEKLVEAVVYADVSYIDATCNPDEDQEDSPLPDVVPNTIEDEPSVVTSSTVVPPRRAPPPLDKEPEVVQEPEPSAAPRRRLTRRATSRASSRALSQPPEPPSQPAVQEEPEPAATAQPAQPRRTLVRRAARPKANATDDESMVVDSAAGRASEEPQAQEAYRRPGNSVPPTPARPSRLKRRVGVAGATQATASAASQLFPPSAAGDDADVLVPDADVREPPLKKYKALFEESDPDRVARMGVGEYASQHLGGSGGGGESVTQYEPSVTFATQASGRGGATMTRSDGTGGRGAGAGSGLGVVMEEEEEGAVLASQTQRGTKRKTQDGGEDVEDEEHPRTRRRTGGEAGAAQNQAPPSGQSVGQHQTQSVPMSKVVTRVDMAQSQVHVKPPKPSGGKKATQQQRGEPDRDDAFLKAVASTKRGKKHEDTFDKEFNNLRISKPDLERVREDEEWKVLEEFGDDGDLRGNFMVVCECPVFRESGTNREHLRRGEGRPEWVGRPDFKKFKKKTTGERRQPVELVVEEESDLGIGSQYWKGSPAALPTQSQSQPHTQFQPRSGATHRLTQRSTKEPPALVLDSDDDEEPFVSKPAKGKSQAKSQAVKPPSAQKSTATRATRGKAGSQRQPLFIDSDDDVDDDGEGAAGPVDYEQDDDFRMDSDPDVGLYGEEEDDDPAATLKSTARSTRSGTQPSSKAKPATARKKAPAIVVDDDSDDGATFKAFGARSRTRRK